MDSAQLISRRAFVAWVGGAGAGFYLFGRLPGAPVATALAQIPGGSLNPAQVRKFATPLLVPPVMPRAGKRKLTDGRDADYYEISMRQFSQQILPSGLPATTVWGYGPVRAEKKDAPLIYNAPSLTIEATSGTPVVVRWINELKRSDGSYLPHLLAVDPTLHWANPPGGRTGRDSRPSFKTTPGRYTGPVPMVTHVHGMSGVGDESDGYAEAWFLPAAKNIPAGYAMEGTWYDFFKAKAQSKGATWGRGWAEGIYPNSQRASTVWYHDHTLGMTRLNVYAGPAGFYLIRGGAAGDDAVIDARSGKRAVLPGPAPQAGEKLPSKQAYYEIPMAIQDRAFNANGSLFYPDTRAFFDGITGPYIPNSDVSPIWNPEFFGNAITVNGNTWPFLNVEKRRYRFRLLNGCNARFLILDFSKIPGVKVWQIGSEGGFLSAPVNMTATNGNTILMGPAERADVIVDFTNVPVGNFVLGNIGPDEPFAGGTPGVDFPVADPATTGQVMRFVVGPTSKEDKSTPPEFLQLPAITRFGSASRVRPLTLLEQVSTFFADAPVEVRLGTIAGNPNSAPAVWTARKWDDPVTENPSVGATEQWEFYNATADAHPMHIHEALFQVVDRQPIFVDEANRTVRVVPGSTASAPRRWERGFKDTVIAYPGMVTRVRLKFATPGNYVWHCHIVEHEDNEMMRPYRVGPVQPGSP